MKDIIKLHSRYASDNNYLKKVEGTEKSYTLKTDYCYRAGKANNGANFIDPSGGPMMIAGEFLPEANAYIESIEEGIITFRE